MAHVKTLQVRMAAYIASRPAPVDAEARERRLRELTQMLADCAQNDGVRGLEEPSEATQAAEADILNFFPALAAAGEAGEQDATLPEPMIGDYVLATKWTDGDPGDPWAVGFYGGVDRRDGMTDRHMVHYLDGSIIRPNGYRCVRLIPADTGAWLLKHANVLESSPPGSLNLLKAIDTPRNAEDIPARASDDAVMRAKKEE